MKTEDEDELYPFAKTDEEKRRAFVVDMMATADIDGHILVQNMHLVCEWLRDGEVPKVVKWRGKHEKGSSDT